MVNFYYGALSTLFSPILGLPKPVAEFIIAMVVTFIITLMYKYLMDQNKAKELRTQMTDIQKKMKELQKESPEKANEAASEMMKLSNQQMKMTFKPMIASLLFVVFFFPWLRSVFTGPIVLLPVSLPYFGSDFGWLMWYMVASIPLSILFRKLMDVM